jgi:hypothetical protein
MANKNALWTLRESRKHGMTSELLTAFRDRAAQDGIDSIDALVRLLRQYIEHGFEGRPDRKQSAGD